MLKLLALLNSGWQILDLQITLYFLKLFSKQKAF